MSEKQMISSVRYKVSHELSNDDKLKIDFTINASNQKGKDEIFTIYTISNNSKDIPDMKLLVEKVHSNHISFMVDFDSVSKMPFEPDMGSAVEYANKKILNLFCVNIFRKGFTPKFDVCMKYAPLINRANVIAIYENVFCAYLYALSIGYLINNVYEKTIRKYSIDECAGHLAKIRINADLDDNIIDHVCNSTVLYDNNGEMINLSNLIRSNNMEDDENEEYKA